MADRRRVALIMLMVAGTRVLRTTPAAADGDPNPAGLTPVMWRHG